MGASVLSPVTAEQREVQRAQSWESGLRAGLAGGVAWGVGPGPRLGCVRGLPAPEGSACSPGQHVGLRAVVFSLPATLEGIGNDRRTHSREAAGPVLLAEGIGRSQRFSLRGTRA